MSSLKLLFDLWENHFLIIATRSFNAEMIILPPKKVFLLLEFKIKNLK
jgi:hypothetical protein